MNLAPGLCWHSFLFSNHKIQPSERLPCFFPFPHPCAVIFVPFSGSLETRTWSLINYRPLAETTFQRFWAMISNRHPLLFACPFFLLPFEFHFYCCPRDSVLTGSFWVLDRSVVLRVLYLCGVGFFLDFPGPFLQGYARLNPSLNTPSSPRWGSRVQLFESFCGFFPRVGPILFMPPVVYPFWELFLSRLKVIESILLLCFFHKLNSSPFSKTVVCTQVFLPPPPFSPTLD